MNDEPPYTLIGKGKQGTVFKLSERACVKVYKQSEFALMECKSYEKGKGSSIIPKLYEVGPGYIIIEYFQGPTLYAYLSSNRSIEKELASRILALIKEMRRIGFTRLDARLFHIFMTKDGELKVIDLVNSCSTVRNVPIVMLEGFKKLGLLDAFMNHIKQLDPHSYKEWSMK